MGWCRLVTDMLVLAQDLLVLKPIVLVGTTYVVAFAYPTNFRLYC